MEFRLASITLDEQSVVHRSRAIEQEREVAIYDLLEKNSFRLEGSAGGPYHLVLGLEESRLVWDVSLEDGTPHGKVHLSLTPLRKVVKDYFLNYRQATNCDCTVSHFGKKVELLGERPADWRISLVDTGIWRNIGERLLAVRHLVQDQEIFLANYSDGLTDAPLPEMINRFKRSGKIASFIAIHPPITFHLADFDEAGLVRRMSASHESEIWINGGYFIFRREIFDYIQDGDELVVEPFKRLIERGELMAYKYEGFWRAMDTLRDRQVLEEMIERGDTPWHPNSILPAAVSA